MWLLKLYKDSALFLGRPSFFCRDNLFEKRMCVLKTWGFTLHHETLRSFRESYDIAITKVVNVPVNV